MEDSPLIQRVFDRLRDQEDLDFAFFNFFGVLARYCLRAGQKRTLAFAFLPGIG